VEAWVNQKKLLSSKCRGCPVYDYCGGACIKSIQHDRECYFYRRLFGWWKKFSHEHQEAVEELGGTV
jgi:sulfatase maturation enzyme AslB (radical SAM superfamily)